MTGRLRHYRYFIWDFRCKRSNAMPFNRFIPKRIEGKLSGFSYYSKIGNIDVAKP